MKNIQVLHFVLYLTTAVYSNEDHLHRTWYTPEDGVDTSKDLLKEGSNIIEVRVLPDPGFIPPPYIKFDRKGLINNENVRKVSRTVSRISTRIEVSSDVNKDNEVNVANPSKCCCSSDKVQNSIILKFFSHR